jgi:protein O-GlcNAc transferase
LIKQEILSLCQNNRLFDAKNQCKQLCHDSPDDAEGWFLLGAINGAMGCFEEAEDCCRHSIAINPDVPTTHYNLGIALLNQYKGEESEKCFQAALRLNPNYVEVYCDLGNAYKIRCRFDAAIECYQQSLALNPSYAMAYNCLSTVYYDQGEFDLAMGCYRKLVELTNSDSARIRLATAVPVIAASNSQIDDTRERINDNLTSLLDQKLQVEDPVREIGVTNFFLAYQGRNDRGLQTKLARLYLQACPSITYVAPHCQGNVIPSASGRIRIGFISKYLMNHSIGKTSRGIIEFLSRDTFEVIVFFLSTPDDEISLHIQQCADQSFVLPNNLAAAQAMVAEQELDILFYQDTGMDILTFFLAFARLAPVQCTSFGHPETTGIPTLDYYISTDMWEPQDSEAHYSEKLVRLKNVASVAYYYRPDVPSSLTPRSAYGLNQEAHVYLCPQALFKFHPDFDDILSGILRRDDQGLLVLIRSSHDHWVELLEQRLQQSMPDVMDRVLFIPQQQGADYMSLLAAADVILDTIHFCGFNTTLEGFAMGTPIVTLPGEFMRSRHTMSFYNKMGITDCIVGNPEQYVDIAVRLGTDPEFRDQVSSKILDKQVILWEDAEVIREFERFFRQAVDELSTSPLVHS